MTAQAGDTFHSPAAAKTALRQHLRRLRRRLPPERRTAAAERAARRADILLRSVGAKTVAVYLPFGGEIDTRPLIRRLLARGVEILVPQVDTQAGRMHFVRLDLTRLSHNRYGIAEPRTRRHFRPRSIDAVVVPLLGFDNRGTRLGAGGGYYDRWFARHARGRDLLRLGYAFAEQRCEALPRDPWDYRLHLTITPERLHRARELSDRRADVRHSPAPARNDE